MSRKLVASMYKSRNQTSGCHIMFSSIANLKRVGRSYGFKCPKWMVTIARWLVKLTVVGASLAHANFLIMAYHHHMVYMTFAATGLLLILIAIWYILVKW
ncbi:hypothetical protein AAC387_Pa11g1201 [Persea americana]